MPLQVNARRSDALLLDQGGDGNVGPMDVVEVEDYALDILELEEDFASGVLDGFDPEDGVHLDGVGIFDDERDVDDAADGSGGNGDDVSGGNVLALDGGEKDLRGVLDGGCCGQAMRQALGWKRLGLVRGDVVAAKRIGWIGVDIGDGIRLWKGKGIDWLDDGAAIDGGEEEALSEKGISMRNGGLAAVGFLGVLGGWRDVDPEAGFLVDGGVVGAVGDGLKIVNAVE